MILRIFSVMFFILCVISSNLAQESAPDTTYSFFTKSIFPVIFYLPETQLGFGVTGILAFDNYDDPSSKLKRVSQVQPSIAYTLKNQVLLFLPYELYFDRDRWKINGELGYFKYFYDFYGVGTNSSFSDRENYDVDYPRLITNVLRRLTPNISAGLFYRFDDYKIKRLTEEGILENGNITGSEGGKLSLLGLAVESDFRDDIFHPYNGSLARASFKVARSAYGSDYNYSKLELSYSQYVSIKERHVMAFDVRTGASFGDIPFYDLFYFGSPKVSRGTLDRRYMDRNFLSIQHEYRFPLWRRLAGVAFHSLSSVSPEWGGLINGDARYVYAYGLGLRFKMTKEQRVRLRLDFAISESTSNFYITVGEAF